MEYRSTRQSNYLDDEDYLYDSDEEEVRPRKRSYTREEEDIRPRRSYVRDEEEARPRKRTYDRSGESAVSRRFTYTPPEEADSFDEEEAAARPARRTYDRGGESTVSRRFTYTPPEEADSFDEEEETVRPARRTYDRYDEDDDERPRRRTYTRDEDDDERPRRRTYTWDEDDDERPRKRTSSGSASSRSRRAPVRRSSRTAGIPDPGVIVRSGALLPFLLKIVAIVLIAVFIGRQFSSEKVSNTPYAEVETAVKGAAALDTMQEGDNQMIKRLYGLDPNEFEGMMLYYPTSNMGAEEVFLAKVGDDTQKEAVRAAIEKRLATQLDSFEGYGVDQTAMLKKAIVNVQGNYVLFVSADDPDSVNRAFEAAL